MGRQGEAASIRVLSFDISRAFRESGLVSHVKQLSEGQVRAQEAKRVRLQEHKLS